MKEIYEVKGGLFSAALMTVLSFIVISKLA